ncbi:MAG TPA: DHH family phosphoesterase [Candidatus Saccharimonadales bacterium]|nr:DHH family phosphoesterase [Candidatus Saccharimonadales bacterium]
MNQEWQAAYDAIKAAKHVVVIQADNPDSDSVGSALALEGLLLDMGTERVTLYCGMMIPRYLRYFHGWDRISDTLPSDFDLWIMVDNSSLQLVGHAMDDPVYAATLKKKPAVVFDHHPTIREETSVKSLGDRVIYLNHPEYIATSELLFHWATALKLQISTETATHMGGAILGDSLGLMSSGTKPSSVRAIADLMDLGYNISEQDDERHEFDKKSPAILAYKAKLIERISYHLDNQLAMIHIPWEEIEKYSDEYNPSALIISEMRMVKGVRVAISIKSYLGGVYTGKLRASNDSNFLDKIASHFGGGGHGYAAGFKIKTDKGLEEVEREIIGVVEECMKAYDTEKRRGDDEQQDVS